MPRGTRLVKPSYRYSRDGGNLEPFARNNWIPAFSGMTVIGSHCDRKIEMRSRPYVQQSHADHSQGF